MPTQVTWTLPALRYELLYQGGRKELPGVTPSRGSPTRARGRELSHLPLTVMRRNVPVRVIDPVA